MLNKIKKMNEVLSSKFVTYLDYISTFLVFCFAGYQYYNNNSYVIYVIIGFVSLIASFYSKKIRKNIEDKTIKITESKQK